MISKNIIKEWLVIIGGTAIVAAAVFFFMLPSHVSVGSAAALAMLIGNFVPIPVSAITAGLNIFLLLIGFLLIGPEFGGKTVFTALLMPGFMWVFEFLFPNFQSITQDPTLDVICYILVEALDLLYSFPAMHPPADLILSQKS